MSLTTFTIIYLIGYILAYIRLRKLDRRKQGNEYSWKHVIENLLTSILSWTVVLIYLISMCFKRIKKVKINVPKWL